jgi:hypothetical protein
MGNACSRYGQRLARTLALHSKVTPCIILATQEPSLTLARLHLNHPLQRIAPFNRTPRLMLALLHGLGRQPNDAVQGLHVEVLLKMFGKTIVLRLLERGGSFAVFAFEVRIN